MITFISSNMTWCKCDGTYGTVIFLSSVSAT